MSFASYIPKLAPLWQLKIRDILRVVSTIWKVSNVLETSSKCLQVKQLRSRSKFIEINKFKFQTNFWSGASWGQFHKLIYALPQTICALRPTFYRDKKCVDDEHPLAGRDIQYWAPDSRSSYMLEMKESNFVCRTNRVSLVKCYDNKKVKSPYNWVISPLTQPQTANQEKSIIFGWLCAVTSLVFT